MISLNSLAAFTAEVSRMQGAAQVRAPSAGSGPAAQAAPESARRLEAVPPQPMSPLPRGSLLDLKV